MNQNMKKLIITVTVAMLLVGCGSNHLQVADQATIEAQQYNSLNQSLNSGDSFELPIAGTNAVGRGVQAILPNELDPVDPIEIIESEATAIDGSEGTLNDVVPKPMTTISLLDNYSELVYVHRYTYESLPSTSSIHYFTLNLLNGNLVAEIQNRICVGKRKLSVVELAELKIAADEASANTVTSALFTGDHQEEYIILRIRNLENQKIESERKISIEALNVAVGNEFFEYPEQLRKVLRSFVDGQALSEISCRRL